MNIPFIAVEGPIGVGKSTLAKAIADHYHYSLLNEIVSENPFLDQFYQDIDYWAFQTEMFFLCNRYKQLEEINNKYLTNHLPVVSDYHIFKNLIFANRTLKEQDFQKYNQVYTILTKDLPQPNVVIYLHASLETLFKRISKRGRDFEKHISSQYLSNLSIDYHNYVEVFKKDHPDIPVLTIDGDCLDFVENQQDLQTIFEKLENLLLKGVTDA